MKSSSPGLISWIWIWRYFLPFQCGGFGMQKIELSQLIAYLRHRVLRYHHRLRLRRRRRRHHYWRAWVHCRRYTLPISPCLWNRQHCTRHRPWRYQPRHNTSVCRLKRISVSNTSRIHDRLWSKETSSVCCKRLGDHVPAKVVHYCWNTWWSRILRIRWRLVRIGRYWWAACGWTRRTFCCGSFGLDLWLCRWWLCWYWFRWTGIIWSGNTWLGWHVWSWGRCCRETAARCTAWHARGGADGRAGRWTYRDNQKRLI